MRPAVAARCGAAVLTAGALIAAAPAHAASAPHPGVRVPPVLYVTGGGDTFRVNGPTSISAGRVVVAVDAGSAGSALPGLASFAAGYSFGQYVHDYATFESELATDPADAITVFRATMARTHYWGGARAETGHLVLMTIVLPAGSYSLFDDSGALPANPRRLVVHGSLGADPFPPTPTVSFEAGDHLAGPASLPAVGTITVANHDPHSPHFLALARVRPDTTSAQVAAYFASGSQDPPAFLAGDESGTDPLAPGGSETLSYSLPAGPYLEYSYFLDPDAGTTDAALGLFRLVTLR